MGAPRCLGIMHHDRTITSYVPDCILGVPRRYNSPSNYQEEREFTFQLSKGERIHFLLSISRLPRIPCLDLGAQAPWQIFYLHIYTSYSWVLLHPRLIYYCHTEVYKILYRFEYVHILYVRYFKISYVKKLQVSI